MKKIAIIAMGLMTMGLQANAQEANSEEKVLYVGEYENPGAEEIKWGAGSWWEKAPFCWYTKYSGIQIIYDAEYLKQLADDNGAIKEVVFKYYDEGSCVELEADLNLLIENTEATEFVTKPDTEDYMWVTYDPSTSSSQVNYSIELWYYQDEEIHFVLDEPLPYTGKSLLVTMWSTVTNDVEAQNLVTYAMRTAAPTTMAMASDRASETFEKVYDTGLMFPYMGPNKYVPVTKFVYTVGAGIGSVGVDAAEAPVQYFNLQGQAVQGELTPGLYIRRQGNTATKVSIK